MTPSVPLPYGNRIPTVLGNKRGRDTAEKLLSSAEASLSAPPLQRARNIAEAKALAAFDSRAAAMEQEIQETFTLAMSDHFQAGRLAIVLPLFATAYRISGDSRFLDAAVRQLEVVAATWSPLQRPGWGLFQPGRRWEESSWDSNSWLATGVGVRALADCLEMLPRNSLSSTLRGRLHRLLVSEIHGVCDDWQFRRPWYISRPNLTTNQWVLPNEGLVCACLLVGRDAYLAQYETGIRNILSALDNLGPDGEHTEGIVYGIFTVTSLMKTARLAATRGDLRLLQHPFLAKFPLWFIHHYQPDRLSVNAFDSVLSSPLPRHDVAHRRQLSTLVSCTGDPFAIWALFNLFDGPSEDLEGLLAAASPQEQGIPPPLFASYVRATRLNWRDSWADSASGFWLRGGHSGDFHDHQDRGHLSFTLRGSPVFIECGTPDYGHPGSHELFRSSFGHNVLHLGPIPSLQAIRRDEGAQGLAVVAPIIVGQLSHAGGSASLEIREGYPRLSLWTRETAWGADFLRVSDLVLLQDGVTEVILLQWHLGARLPVDIKVRPTGAFVAWDDICINFSCDSEMVIQQFSYPDRTLPFEDDPESESRHHILLTVQTAHPVGRARFQVEVLPSERPHVP